MQLFSGCLQTSHSQSKGVKMEGNVLKRQRAAGLWESFNFCQLSAFDTFTGALLPRVQTPNRAAASKTCHLSPQAAFPASLRRDRCTDGEKRENTPSSDSEGCVLPQPRDNPVSHSSSVSSSLKKEALQREETGQSLSAGPSPLRASSP